MPAKKIENKKVALWYAKFGWLVFPCRVQSKEPLVAHGWKDASSDPDVIAGWWDTWPDANIGLACGPSGIIALDGDPNRYNEESDRFIAYLKSECLYASQSTPTGGIHFLFMAPATPAGGTPLSNRRGALPPGIDVRVNGYVLLAPSQVTYHGQEALDKGVADGFSGHYRWLVDPKDLLPTPLPDDVLQLLLPPPLHQASAPMAEGKNGPPVEPVAPKNELPDDKLFYARSALERELDALARTPVGGRNNQLNNSAFNLGQLVAAGLLDQSEVDQKLTNVAVAIGLSDSEIRSTLKSGIGAGSQHPRQVKALPRLKFRYSDQAPNGAERDEGPAEETNQDTAPDLEELLLHTEKTDLGNALVALRLSGDKLAYTAEQGWLYRRSTHWERDEAVAEPTLRAIDALQQRCEATMHALAGQEGLGKALAPVIPSAKHVRDLLYLLRPMVSYPGSDFDNTPYLLNCRNGVVDLRTGDLVTHSASDRFTYCVAADYAPDAWQDGLFHRLVSQWFNGEVEQVDYLQRALGYSITGETREECMFYLLGERGRNGKGTMVNGVAEILGFPLVQTVTMRAFTAKSSDPQGFLLAPLHNARLAIASEKSKGSSLDEELLKTVTGRDSIQVAFKGRTPFNFTPKFKLWLMANNPPKGDPSDDAFWSRVRVVTMPNSYQGKEDNTLKDRLRHPDERQASLAWLVLGAVQWYRHGLGPNAWVKGETERVRTEQDTVLQFAGACLQAADTDVRLSEVYLSYEAWCQAEGIPAKPKNQLTRDLRLRGFNIVTRSTRLHGDPYPKQVVYVEKFAVIS